MKYSRISPSGFSHRFIVILLLVLFCITQVQATPDIHWARWPAGATINVWIQNIDPAGPNSRQQLVADGIARWRELLGRGYTININFGNPPAGTQNLVHFTWAPVGASLPGDNGPDRLTLNGNDAIAGYTGVPGDPPAIISGVGIIKNNLPANNAAQREYIRNLGMHEFTHALGLADDPNGVVTNHWIQNDGTPMDPNETDLAEIALLYGDAIDPNQRPQAIGQLRDEKSTSYVYDFTFNGQAGEHVTLISLEIEPELVTSIVVPPGWIYLDPDDPSSYDRTAAFYDDYMEDWVSFPLLDPIFNRIDRLIFRSLNSDSALTTQNPNLTITIDTDHDIAGTIRCWAGGDVQYLEGPVPPIDVDAGADQEMFLPYYSTTLDATAAAGGPVTLLWTVLNQPAGSIIMFDDDTAEDPLVTFDMVGEYLLRLTASDGNIEIYDDVLVSLDVYPSFFSVIVGADDPSTAVTITDGGLGDVNPAANILRFEDVIPGMAQGSPVGWKASGTVYQTITGDSAELRGTIWNIVHRGGPDPVTADVVFSSNSFTGIGPASLLRCHFDGEYVKVDPNDGSQVEPGMPLTAADALLEGFADGEYFGEVDPPCKGIDCVPSEPTLGDYHFGPPEVPDFVIQSDTVTSLSGRLTVNLGEASGGGPVIPADGFVTTISAVISATVDPGLPPCGGIVMQGDVDEDCRVDLNDLMVLASDWLDCYDPIGGSCP